MQNIDVPMSVRMADVQNERCSTAQYLCRGPKQQILLALWTSPSAKQSWPERRWSQDVCDKGTGKEVRFTGGRSW